MTIEEFLKPRYKVIADYPGRPAFEEIGTIINVPDTKYIYADDTMCEANYFNRWPDVYKKLAWWEDREEKDMPEYVKRKDGSEVFQRAFGYNGSGSVMVKYPKGKYGSGTVGPIGLSNLLPATESEFLNQNKQAY